MRTRSAAAAAAAAGGGGGAAGAGGGAAAGEEDEAALAGGLLNATEAKMRLTELVGEELAAQLGDPMWKVRTLTVHVVAPHAFTIQGPAPVRALCQSGGAQSDHHS